MFLKLFKLTIDNCGYDCFAGLVVAAESEEEAFHIAYEFTRNSDSKDAFLKASIEKIGFTLNQPTPGVVMSDFNAG